MKSPRHLRHQLHMVTAAVSPEEQDVPEEDRKANGFVQQRLQQAASTCLAWARNPPRRIWPISGGLLGMVLVLIWLAPQEIIPATFHPDRPHVLYLLSAAAQVLAAVLALVFTLVLIVAQLSSTYSNRMLNRFFDRATIGYILLFVISILVCLYGVISPIPFIVRMGLSLSSCCLFLVLPYFLSFRYRLNPETMLEGLYNESYEAIGKRHEPMAAQAIDNAMMGALARRDYDTFRRGAELLATLALNAYDGDDEFLGQRALTRLASIATVAADDEVVPKEVVDRIQYVAMEAFVRVSSDNQGSSRKLVVQSLNLLCMIGKGGIRGTRRNIVESVVGSVTQIGSQAAELSLNDIVRSTLWGLRGLWIEAYERDLGEMLVMLAYPVWLIGKLVAQLDAEDESANAAGGIATVRAQQFIRVTEFDRPGRPAGNAGTTWTAVDMLREIGSLLRDLGRRRDLENVIEWLHDIGDAARAKGFAEVAEDTKRVVRDLGQR